MGQTLIDPDATEKTRALYENLTQTIDQGNILLGHQDATAYGVGWRSEEERSDVKEVVGDFPAVYGWNVSKIGQGPMNIDSVDFERMKDLVKNAYKRGGINTFCWHADHPTTGGDSWDKTPAVKDILPGGPHHTWLTNKLDLIAEYFNDLSAGFLFKHKIPIIFRPYHEHTGSWFWWGKGNCSVEEFVALWRFTVEYLRDEKELHQLIYAYSPDIVHSKEEYLERYPGDDYVDIMGFDDYGDFKPGQKNRFIERMRWVVELAEEHGKIAALTETGLEAIPDSNWWTKQLLEPLKKDPVASRFAYMVLWRNAWPNHHYAPYPGQKSAENFKKFVKDPMILMEKDLPDMYHSPK